MKIIITLFLVLLSSFSVAESQTITINAGGAGCPAFVIIDAEKGTSNSQEWIINICDIAHINGRLLYLRNYSTASGFSKNYFYVDIADIDELLTKLPQAKVQPVEEE